MSDLVVEVWEHESWAVGRGWAVAQDFRTREGVAAASTLETYASPRGYLWSGDWSLGVVYGRNGYELPQGWEYALKVDHFGARALAPGPASDLGAPPPAGDGRAPRGRRGFDWARRRQWTRTAKLPARRGSARSPSAALSRASWRAPAAPPDPGRGRRRVVPSLRLGPIHARVTTGLEMVARARSQLQQTARLAGTDLDSADLRDALDALGAAVKKGALEVTTALDGAGLSDNRAKKLRRDLHREVSAAADVLRTLPLEPDRWPSIEEERARAASGDPEAWPAPMASNASARRRGSQGVHVVESGSGAFVLRADERPDSVDCETALGESGRYVARGDAERIMTQRTAAAESALNERIRSVSSTTVLDTIVRERAEAIAEIHASTLTLNNIARDLAGEVDRQQETVDALETRAEETLASVQRGGDQIRRAADVQKKTFCTIS